MATVQAVPELDLPPFDITVSNKPNRIDVDGDSTAEVKQDDGSKSDSQTDSQLERTLKSLKRDFKERVPREFRGRHRRSFDPKRGNKKKRRTFLPPPIDDTLAEMILRHIGAAELSLDGVKELPSGENIMGAVIIIRVRETGEYICSFDKAKHGRWGFPGGRRDPTDLNIAHTLLRELKEETRLRGKRFRYSFIGCIPLMQVSDKVSAVFFTEIPDVVAASMQPGREQYELKRFSCAQIYEMILKWEFLPNHANYILALERWEA